MRVKEFNSVAFVAGDDFFSKKRFRVTFIRQISILNEELRKYDFDAEDLDDLCIKINKCRDNIGHNFVAIDIEVRAKPFI